MTASKSVLASLGELLGRPNRPIPPPRPGRGLQWSKPRSKTVVRERGPHRVEAAAWFLVAVTILAFGAAPEPQAQVPGAPPDKRPLWRRYLSQLVGMAPEAPEGEVKAVEAREPGRGRDARSPAEIPPKGWKDIGWRTWNEFNKDRIPAVAGGVTFFGLLAVFPALGAFVSLYGLFSDAEGASKQLAVLAGLLPPDVLSFVGDQMMRLASGKHSGLGLAFAASFLVSLWSANAGVKALLDGLNIAYEERERRGLIRLNLVSLAFTLGGVVLILAVLGLVVALPLALSLVRYGGPDPMLLLRWPLMLAVLIGVLELVYRYGPSRQTARWRWVSWGGVAAALLWVFASIAFSWYVANFAHYDRTYGSLGAVVGFMTWLWITSMVVLLGAELNAEIEHQTAVDSTTGHAMPMGARGAKMADTLGETADAAKAKPREADVADPRALRAGAAPVQTNSKPAPMAS